jgi:hypothetical protein
MLAATATDGYRIAIRGDIEFAGTVLAAAPVSMSQKRAYVPFKL